ncbi:MAG: hypothetical protein ACPLYF_03590, partial [Fervidobacterium sp.]
QSKTINESYYLYAMTVGDGSSSYYWDWVVVRKYTDPEPTYSIGAEETANQPPQVFIFFPKNQTYYGSIPFEFKAIDDLDSAFTLKAYLNGMIEYENASYGNNTLISYSKLLPPGTYNFTVYAEDSGNATAKEEVIFVSEGSCGDNICSPNENAISCFKDCGGAGEKAFISTIALLIGISSITLTFSLIDPRKLGLELSAESVVKIAVMLLIMVAILIFIISRWL